ncbi:MAG: hypothetical protein GFH27_549397n11 [Chloroflexi bacterium AL-W]|nr:hypothetical protein [Chloroflexi bacterium AL-W]
MSKPILFDADVLIHFSKGRALHLLPLLYPGRICVLDQVREELSVGSAAREWVETQIALGNIQGLALPDRLEVIREYAQLHRRMGRGESACLALARYDDRYLASSNLRDIQSYCRQYNIRFVTTMDVLAQVERQGIWRENTCDEFIHSIRKQGSRLPVNSLAEYRNRFEPRKL